MTKIPEGFVKVDDRKILKQGSSIGVTIPRNILKENNVDMGDIVALYNNGKGLLIVDLKPKKK